MCNLCKSRGKTWSGGDPHCGFPDGGNFDPGNWNCATLNELRGVAEKHGTIQYLEDTSIAIIPVNDDEQYTGWIVLSWYKSRGRTSSARFIFDETDIPLTLAIAEAALKQYEN